MFRLSRIAVQDRESTPSSPPNTAKRARGIVKDNTNLIVGLDIGTSKIVAIVAEVLPDGGLNIVGLGTQPSRG